jgi:hypothetical protein
MVVHFGLLQHRATGETGPKSSLFVCVLNILLIGRASSKPAVLWAAQPVLRGPRSNGPCLESIDCLPLLLAVR